MTNFLKWLHHLFNPHCELCKIEELENERAFNEYEENKNRCKSCELLQMELAKAHEYNNKLLDLLHPTVEKQARPVESENLKPIPVGKQFIPQRVRNEMIAQNDRRTLELLKKRTEEINSPVPIPSGELVVENTKSTSTEELEQELLKTNILESNG